MKYRIRSSFPHVERLEAATCPSNSNDHNLFRHRTSDPAGTPPEVRSPISLWSEGVMGKRAVLAARSPADGLAAPVGILIFPFIPVG